MAKTVINKLKKHMTVSSSLHRRCLDGSEKTIKVPTSDSEAICITPGDHGCESVIEVPGGGGGLEFVLEYFGNRRVSVMPREEFCVIHVPGYAYDVADPDNLNNFDEYWTKDKNGTPSYAVVASAQSDSEHLFEPDPR